MLPMNLEPRDYAAFQGMGGGHEQEVEQMFFLQSRDPCL